MKLPLLQAITVTMLGLSVALLAIAVLRQGNRIRDLRGDIACLEHPHQESSTAGRMVGTPPYQRFVVTRPPTLTGCP